MEKRFSDLEKKYLEKFGTDKPFKTVFEINLKTAVKTAQNGFCFKAVSKDGKHVITQPNVTYAPINGPDYLMNLASDYMIFICPELQFGNISIFVVSQTPDTSGHGSWRYIIGNDNGGYDKFISYKAYSYSKIIFGGERNGSMKTVTVPNRFSIQHNKNLLSCHWMQSGSCMYGNGSKLVGSDFDANLKHIGSPFGSIFFNERFYGSSTTNNNKLKGKIFGFKIVQGLLTPADIVNIHAEMIKEYNVDI